MMVSNFLYSTSYYFLNIIIIFLLSTYFSLGGNATEPTIFQHFKAKFVHTFSYKWLCEKLEIKKKQCA